MHTIVYTNIEIVKAGYDLTYKAKIRVRGVKCSAQTASELKTLKVVPTAAMSDTRH